MALQGRAPLTRNRSYPIESSTFVEIITFSSPPAAMRVPGCGSLMWNRLACRESTKAGLTSGGKEMLRKFVWALLALFVVCTSGVMRADNTCSPSAPLWGVTTNVIANDGGGNTAYAGLSQSDGTCLRSYTSSAGSNDDYGGEGFASAGASIGHSGAYAEATGGRTSSAGANWWDNVTITSSDPNQQYATFTLTLSLSAAFVGDGSGTAFTRVNFSAADNSFIWDKSVGLNNDYDPNAPTSISEQVVLYVGETFNVTGGIAVRAFGSQSCDQYGVNCTPESEQVLATHSGAFSLVSNDPNASFTTASGCALDGNPCGSAPTSTPEPASAWLLASALLVPVIRNRRKKSNA